MVTGAVLLLLAGMSLLWTREPTYDPWSWILWSREIAHGSLSTTTGPSWKPLPVLLTVPFALVSDTLAPLAWLVIARAGGLLALVLTFRLGHRLAGPWAGTLAALSLLLASGFVRDAARGNSEGLLVALVLGALLRHLDGGRRSTWLLLLGAALLRPEVWPALLLYGLYLVLRVPGSRVLVAVSLLALAVLWLGPEYVGSGNALRASDRARQPNPDSAAFAAWPFLEVLRRSASVLAIPVLAGAAVGLVFAVRQRRRLVLLLGALAAVLLAIVAAMTQVGYSGNLRYVVLPGALLCAVAGWGWVRAARAWRWPTAVAALLALPFLVVSGQHLRDDLRFVQDEAELYGDLPAAVALAGGREKVLQCGQILTGPYSTPTLAWTLDARLEQTELFPDSGRPGTVIIPRLGPGTGFNDPLSLWRDPGYTDVGTTAHWLVRERCG